MGKPAAKKTDQIVSATPGDIHIIMVPSPGGPVPTPIPHPCTSIITDAVAEKVKVMGQPGAVKGSVSKHSPPHVPMGPGPFQKPPANKGKIVTASSNVFFEGKEAAMLGDTAMMCADPADAPVGKVIGTAATVLIGGGGSGADGEANASAAGQVATGANTGNQATPPLDKATAEGHPVDVVTGNVIAQGEDFSLEGPIALQFVRTYSSGNAAQDGTLGCGWSHNLQQRIDLLDVFHSEWQAAHEQFSPDDSTPVNQDYLVYRDANGVPTTYRAPATGDAIVDHFRRRVIRRELDGFVLVDSFEIEHRFTRRAPSSTTYLPLQSVDRNGNRVQFRYDSAGRPSEVEDPYGRTLVLSYRDDRIAELSVRIPGVADRRWCSYRYDEFGNLVQVVDRAGFHVRYGYADHLLVEERNRDDYAFYFSYDAKRRCVFTWGQDGYLTRRLEYDADKRCTRVVNGEGESTVYRYNAFNVVHRVERGSDLYQETRYDGQGRVIARASGKGVAATFTYDEAGHVQSAGDGEGHEHRFVYNEAGQVTELTDAADAVQRFSYDARGNLVAATSATGAVTTYEYDERGRLIRQSFPGGGERMFAYDEFGHVTRVVDAGDIATYQYDAFGQLTKRVAANGTVYTYEWNDQGYPVRETTNGVVTAVLEYTREGNVSSAIDAAGILRTYEFGPPGVPVTIVEYAASSRAGQRRVRSRVTIDVDSEGRPRSATNELGQSYDFVYDDAGRVARQTSPDGTTLWFSYDQAGLVDSILTSHGERQRFEYNGRGLPTRVVYADQSEDTFEYDPMGRTTAATNHAVRLEWEYDAAGQVSTRRQGEFELHCELEGRDVAWVSSDDFRVGIVPNDRGELDTIDFGGRRIHVAGHRAPTLETRITLPNGVVERHMHDVRGRRVHDEIRTPERLLVHRRLEYGVDGHVHSIDDSMRGGLRTFSYDELDRLVEVQGAWSERYAFDAASNIVSSHRFEATKIEAPDQLQRLDHRSYEYDPAGRVSRITDGDRSWRLHYNAKGEVAKVDLPDAGTVHYEYDPLGRRIEKRFEGGLRDGRRVRFIWNGGDVFKEEVLSHGDVTRERFYLFFADGPRARIDRDAEGDESEVYYHNDHIGTPQFCTDENRNIVWTFDGDSYGYESRPDADDFQNIRLPGQYFDEETGLHYNRFRYYDPVSSRYLQPDPIDTLTNPNRFNYPLDPLGGIDPLGLALLVLNADPGDKTLPVDSYLLSGNLPNQSFPNRTGYRSSSDPVGTMRHLLDPNLGNLGQYDHIVINAHGNPSSISVGRPGVWAKIRRKFSGGRYFAGSMSGAELAALLKAKGFKGKVTLVACNSAGSNGKKANFAQELADGLGAGSEVVAWDEAVIVDSHTGRACAVWNMGEAIPSIDSALMKATRDQTWGPMPEAYGRWTFREGQPPVPG